MVEYIAYIASLCWPMLIIGFGAMVDDVEGAVILAYINFVALSTYFLQEGRFEGWVFGVFYIIVSLIIVLLFKSLFSGGGQE